MRSQIFGAVLLSLVIIFSSARPAQAAISVTNSEVDDSINDPSLPLPGAEADEHKNAEPEAFPLPKVRGETYTDKVVNETDGAAEDDGATIEVRPVTKPSIKVEDKLKKEVAAPAKVEKVSAKSAKTSEKKPAKGSTEKKTEAAKASVEGESVAAETSLRWLQNGNTRYLKHTVRADGKSAKDRKRLVGGERPHAIILSCSDSRVPPEVVFDQALGEVFVIRVAGESLDASVVASIEYAVENLGVRLLVVMGHSQCSAVKTALSAKDGESAGSADLDRLISDIRPRLKTVINDKPSENFEVEAAVNADGVARELVRRSDIIRKKVDEGGLVIKTALYRLDSGKVSFY